MKQKNNIWEMFRGIAAISVMFHHYTERYDSLFGHISDWPLQSLYGGQYGVCMFFIFTGMFLMPSLIKCDNFGLYLKKRALRLYPYYIPCVIITFVCMLIAPPLPGRETSLCDFIANLTMFQSYIGFRHVDGAYWTLAVQLLVYILMGSIFFVFKKNRKRFLFVILLWFLLDLALSIIDLLFGLSMFSTVLLVRTIQLFVQGILIWYISTEEIKRYKIVSQVALLLSPLYSLFYYSLNYTLFNFIIVGVVYCLTMKRCSYSKTNIFTFLGSISFPLYLLHQNIGYLIIRYMENLGLMNEFFIFIPMLIITLFAWIVTLFVNKVIMPQIPK